MGIKNSLYRKLQLKLISVITLGQKETDNINWRISISGYLKKEILVHFANGTYLITISGW